MICVLHTQMAPAMVRPRSRYVYRFVGLLGVAPRAQARLQVECLQAYDPQHPAHPLPVVTPGSRDKLPIPFGHCPSLNISMRAMIAPHPTIRKLSILRYDSNWEPLMLEAAESKKPSPIANTVILIHKEAPDGSPLPGRSLRSSCTSNTAAMHSAPTITPPHSATGFKTSTPLRSTLPSSVQRPDRRPSPMPSSIFLWRWQVCRRMACGRRSGTVVLPLQAREQ